MGAVLKILGYVLAAVGLVAWLGGAAVVAWEILRDPLASGDAAAMASAGITVAGLLIAAVGAVVVLRVTHNLIPYALCLVCGALAFFGGLKINPLELLNEPLQAALLVGIIAAPVAVLATTRKMVYFLSTFALIAALGAVVLATQFRLGAPAPTDRVGGAAQGAGAPPVANEAAPPPVANNVPVPPPVTQPTAPAQPSPQAAAPKPAEEAELEARTRAVEEAARRADEKTQTMTSSESAARQAEAQAGAAAPAPSGGGLGGFAGRLRSLSRSAPATAAPSPPPPAPPPPPAMADAAPPPAAGPDLNAPSGGGSGALASAGAPPATEPATTEAPKPPTADEFGYRDANLKFNKPDKMELGTEYTVGATITLPGSTAAPATLGDVGPTVTRETKITRKVRVELVGGGSFDVTAANPVTTFLITADTPGVWNWRVTPRKEGQGTMQLQVFGVLENNGVSEGEVLIKTYQETIPVTVTPMGRVRLISQNVVDNWEPVAGALGAVGGIWAFFAHLFAGLRRKRETA